MARRKSAFDKRIVVCGVLTALSVILLYLGGIIEVLDLSMSAIVSILIVVVVIEMGYSYSWLTYIATSILSLVMLPQKTPAIFYACFMGFYPIVKSFIERINKGWLRWLVKLLVGHAAIGLMFLFMSIFVPEDFNGDGLIIITYALAISAFVLYDIALSKLITLYFKMIRERIKIYKFLK